MSAPAPLIDPFGRTVRDLRISVTDRCNFRCTYCMPEEGMKWLDRSEVLTFEEIQRFVRICVERFDVDGIRLTGGEPLLRRHLERLIEMLSKLQTPEGKPLDLTLTTNGSLLKRKAHVLKAAGLQRVTVSLDGIDDYVSVADANSLSFGNGTSDTPLSMEMWFRPNAMGRAQLLGKWGETANQEYRLQVVSGGSFRFDIRDNTDVTYLRYRTKSDLRGAKYVITGHTHQGEPLLLSWRRAVAVEAEGEAQLRRATGFHRQIALHHQRREALQGQQKGQGHVLCRILLDGRFGQPRADIALPLNPCGFEMIEAQPRDNPAQKGGGHRDLCMIHKAPAQKGVLHEVIVLSGRTGTGIFFERQLDRAQLVAVPLAAVQRVDMAQAAAGFGRDDEVLQHVAVGRVNRQLGLLV